MSDRPDLRTAYHRAVRVAICFSLILVIAATTRGKDWRGIIPLHSTRSDVARILGADAASKNEVYSLEDEVVLVSYSKGTCAQGGIWNVRRDIVIMLTVTPKKTVRVSSLDLDLARFVITSDRDLPGYLYYDNSEDGIHIATFNGKVASINYLPTFREETLRCRRQEIGLLTKSGVLINPHTIFDRYQHLDLTQAKSHLELWGQEMTTNSDTKGYIACYGPRKRERQAAAKRAKNYLLTRFRIKPERLEIVDAGVQPRVTLELYLAH